MAAFFLDSSAVVKRYVAELGRAWVRGLADPAMGHEIYLARITAVEVVSAFVRHDPPLSPSDLHQALADFGHDLQSQYRLIEVSDLLVGRAMSLAEQHRLRGYDAVQLAAAVEVNAHRAMLGGMTLGVAVLGKGSITFVSADKSLNAAATAEALTVDDPSLHP